jgi:hypothetical protein
MKLAYIKELWHFYNTVIFAAAGQPLPEVTHRRTRASDYWACWHFKTQSYIWNYNLDGVSCKRSLIAHEMVHQWQDTYYLASYREVGYNYNYHDILFYSWEDEFKSLGLILSEEL